MVIYHLFRSYATWSSSNTTRLLISTPIIIYVPSSLPLRPLATWLSPDLLRELFVLPDQLYLSMPRHGGYLYVPRWLKKTAIQSHQYNHQLFLLDASCRNLQQCLRLLLPWQCGKLNLQCGVLCSGCWWRRLSIKPQFKLHIQWIKWVLDVSAVNWKLLQSSQRVLLWIDDRCSIEWAGKYPANNLCQCNRRSLQIPCAYSSHYRSDSADCSSSVNCLHHQEENSRSPERCYKSRYRSGSLWRALPQTHSPISESSAQPPLVGLQLLSLSLWFGPDGRSAENSLRAHIPRGMHGCVVQKEHNLPHMQIAFGQGEPIEEEVRGWLDLRAHEQKLKQEKRVEQWGRADII